jgi:hypothetical protein
MKTDTFNFSKGANNNISLIMTKKISLMYSGDKYIKLKKLLKTKRVI